MRRIAKRKTLLKTRTTAALRAKLDAAARKSGRSLGAETEHRVEQSFEREMRLRELQQIRQHIENIDKHQRETRHALRQMAATMALIVYDIRHNLPVPESQRETIDALIRERPQ